MPQAGTKAAAWLRQVGVRCRADLERLGPVETFLRVKRAGFKPTLNLLWSLEAALRGCHWTAVPPERREELKAALAEAEARLLAVRSGSPAQVVRREGAGEAEAASAFPEALPFEPEEREPAEE